MSIWETGSVRSATVRQGQLVCAAAPALRFCTLTVTNLDLWFEGFTAPIALPNVSIFVDRLRSTYPNAIITVELF